MDFIFFWHPKPAIIARVGEKRWANVIGHTKPTVQKGKSYDQNKSCDSECVPECDVPDQNP